MTRRKDPMNDFTFEDCVRLHGHLCGGITLGYVMSVTAMEALGAKRGDKLYCVSEIHSCPCDAIQCITGCTTGTRTLEIADTQTMAMTLVRAADGKGVRVTIDPKGIEAETRQELSDKILAAGKTLCTVTKAELKVPEKIQAKALAALKNQ